MDIGDTTLSVTAKVPSSDKEYSLELDLAHPVTPAQSSYKVMTTKIEIKLKKAEGRCPVVLTQLSRLQREVLEEFSKNMRANEKDRTSVKFQDKSANFSHDYQTSLAKLTRHY